MPVSTTANICQKPTGERMNQRMTVGERKPIAKTATKNPIITPKTMSTIRLTQLQLNEDNA